MNIPFSSALAIDDLDRHPVRLLDVGKMVEWTDFLWTNPWIDHPLNKEMITDAEEHRPPPTFVSTDWTYREHMGRVAYIAKRRDQHRDPITVEVDHVGPLVIDGNHRLAAWWFADEPTIAVRIINQGGALPSWVTESQVVK